MIIEFITFVAPRDLVALCAKRMDSSHKTFRQQSLRLSRYDYSQKGYYFITVCTKDRQELFGTIGNGKTELSNIGITAETFLSNIQNHFQNVELDEYVVMPNHVH